MIKSPANTTHAHFPNYIPLFDYIATAAPSSTTTHYRPITLVIALNNSLNDLTTSTSSTSTTTSTPSTTPNITTHVPSATTPTPITADLCKQTSNERLF